jgi:hypothetical protein
MASYINLSRDARVILSFLGNTASITASNSASLTQEIKVLDGFSFNQDTGTQDVALNESGPNSVRGKKTFNTSLNPVDVSFTTYIRPFKIGNTSSCMEDFLWRALINGVSSSTGNDYGNAVTRSATSVSYFMSASNVDVLPEFYVYFIFENTSYMVSKCQVNSAEIDFGIDQIGQITWSLQGTTITKLAAADHTALLGWTNLGASTPIAKLISAPVDTSKAPFIPNKLSFVTLKDNAGGFTTSTVTYSITGGSISINNNLTALTPEELATVNFPIGSFTGTRDISGNFSAYLRVGNTASDAGELLNYMIANAQLDDTENYYALNMYLGGNTTGTPRVHFNFPVTQISIPSVDVQDVLSTTINFFAKGYTSITESDLTAANEMAVTYYHNGTNAALTTDTTFYT